MEEVRDSIYYPRPFKYFIVTSKDGNNDPLITKFFTKKQMGLRCLDGRKHGLQMES